MRVNFHDLAKVCVLAFFLSSKLMPSASIQLIQKAM